MNDTTKQEMNGALISEGMTLAENAILYFLSLLIDDIALSDKIMRIKDDFIEKNHLRYHFNVISAAARGRLLETAHSLILSNLLRNPIIQKSFFEEVLGIEFAKAMFVETEFGNSKSHVDIILYNKRSCVIIENKVNGAMEQEHQVYRYVHDIAEDILKINRENIYVLYLNPYDNASPSLQTVTNDCGRDNLLESMGNRFIIKSFANDIVHWLSNLDFPTEPYKSGVRQYIDYLENYFHTSVKYEPMKREIKEFILKEYSIENCSLEQQIGILEQKKQNVDFLAEQLISLIKDKKEECARGKLKDLYNRLKVDYNNIKGALFYDNTEKSSYINVGIGLLVNGMRTNFHIEYDSNNSQIYYGIICSSKIYPEAYAKLENLFAPYFESLPSGKEKPTPGWPVWTYTSFGNAYARLQAIIEFALNLPA